MIRAKRIRKRRFLKPPTYLIEFSGKHSPSGETYVIQASDPVTELLKALGRASVGDAYAIRELADKAHDNGDSDWQLGYPD